MKFSIVKDFLVAQYKIIRGNRFGMFGAVVLLFFGIIALFAPYIAPHDLWESLRDSSGKMAILRQPCLEFPLGTTAMGRDILSQLILATRTTVLIGLTSGLVSILVGANIGLLAGYYGGKLDEIFMRFTDIVYGMPFLPFLIVLISLFGRNIWFVIIAICCIIWRTSARVIRAQV
ncbi:MAG: ABC transporter permease, partial [Proteobacteria bacterium]|nr:ABC transporter permease [Pseudomonadota bacterium]